MRQVWERALLSKPVREILEPYELVRVASVTDECLIQV
jgi:hypothetical protein